MLAIELITPWQEKDPQWRLASDDYINRLQKKWRFTERQSTNPLSKNSKIGKNSKKKQSKKQPQRESAATNPNDFWPVGSFRIAVTERGEQVTSPELAQRLEKWVMQRDQVVLTIGSAYGLAPEIEASANWQWSLGKLIYPHQLARLIVLEQLYRAATILAGEPYHHGENAATP